MKASFTKWAPDDIGVPASDLRIDDAVVFALYASPDEDSACVRWSVHAEQCLAGGESVSVEEAQRAAEEWCVNALRAGLQLMAARCEVCP